ncbi:MAG: hypothetical protein ACRD3W_01425, partial [Terriglobales bacterium]
LVPSAEMAERADKLFAKAMDLKNELSKLPALSNDRIAAENDYTKSLRESLILFRQAFESTKDIVMKAHTHNRMEQIFELCQQQLESGEAKKQAG